MTCRRSRSLAVLFASAVLAAGASTQEPGASTQQPGASTQQPGASTQQPGASTQEPIAPTPEHDAAAHTLPARPESWSPAVLADLATLPVQEGGRIKPLSAFAAQTLLLVHGRRDMKLDTDGDKKPDLVLSPTEWLLDVLFLPEVAADFPLFRIENVDVLDAIGIAHEGGQRFDFEYLTYRQLVTPGANGKEPAEVLWRLARSYRAKAAQEQTPVEAHIIRTDEGVDAFATVLGLLSPLQRPFHVEGEQLRAMFAGAEQVAYCDLLRHGQGFAELVRQYRDKTSDPALGNAMILAGLMAQVAQNRSGPALLPPPGSRGETLAWAGLPALTEAALKGGADAAQLAQLQQLEAAARATTQAARERELLAFRAATVERAIDRGEFSQVALEDYYLASAWHYQALHWFLLAILIVALSWTMPRSRWAWRASVAATIVPLGFLVADVVLRCIVRGRPPILNLYDTFLFIASVGVTAAVVTEIVTRRRIAISLAPLFGALLIALARAFELGDGRDQMAPLQAVLDTNYYLATHVTSINMGYAAGMFASFLGTTWLLLNALGVRRNDAAFHKSIVRATYGVTAFGLIFAVFGTIYGGVWANDSWGRFWGWDPKENGALLICIAQVSLLHARMVGWVRDFGFCLCAAATGIVVAFSWFHVNLLGIGLHSYGFSNATKVALFTYYGVQLGLCVLGTAGVLWRRRRSGAGEPAAVVAATS